jgi:hypothetical protein
MPSGPGEEKGEQRMNETFTIERSEFVSIVGLASAYGCADSTRAKLRQVAETTEAVAAGWFHCDGHQCPAMQAGRRNQLFQTAFDRAMAAHFGVTIRKDKDHDRLFEPFVVRVLDKAVSHAS